jgi:DNA polymerase I-like protein with 3'-5' exonuclease and polymerase domains
LWLAPRAAVEGEARAVTLQPGHIRGRFTLSDVGGFAVSWATSKSFVLPLRHAREGDEPPEVAPRVVWDAVCEASEDAARTVIVGDAQRRLQLLRALGAAPRCLWSDPLVAHWLLQPEEKRALTVADLFAHYVARGDREGGGQVAAGRALVAAGTAVAAIAHQVPASLEAAARESSQTWAVATKLRQMLTTEGLQRVFDELEAPLVPVLAEMEWHGFAFDAAASARHRFDLAARLALLEHVAHRNAPSRFNLQSPDECGRVLFAELKLPPPPLARVFGVARAPQPQPQQLQQQQGDEGESRRFSSSRRVLQALARSHPHPVVSAIAEHRSLAHFFAKHMVGLPQCAVRDAAQSKERSADAALSSSALRPPPPPSPPPPPQSPPLSVHSALLQCEAATGRVVSVDPSLQTLSRGVVLPLAPLLSVHQELADAAATAAVEAAMREPPDSLLRAAVALTPARDCVRGQLVAVLRERSLTQPAAEGANGESLAEFWGARGFAYSEADAMKVCQVVLATDLGCSQTLPADKVWRLETACSCAASPPRPPLLTLRPPRETVRLSGRAALVARGGFRLLSADYAQMELRVLAHLSGDAELCSLFEAGTDAVSALAAELLAVPPAAVTRQLRTRAKQLLYGVVYGMGAQALAHELAVSPAEAAALIERATQRFPDALAFQRLTLERFRCQGYVETLGGRRRLLPQLRSRVPSERARAERQAFSTLVQGSAADVMKRALVLLRQRLEEAGLAARLLLVVHDEVLLEARVGELERTRAVLQHALEHAWPMRVPLRVRVREGASWAALAEAEAEVGAAGAIGAEDDGSQSESESPSEGEGEGKAP